MGVAVCGAVLRITRESDAGSTRIAVEGRLVGEWVALLRDELERSETSGHTILLDLARVHFAGDAGLMLLRAARARGIEVVGCSPLLATLLAGDER